MQQGIYEVSIGTGDISGTDFSKMTLEARHQLHASGKRAFQEFVTRERENVGRHRIASQFSGFDERMLLYVHAFEEARTSILISDSSAYWLWFTMPTLTFALNRGVKVYYFGGPVRDGETEAEERRRSLLRSMGCSVVNVEDVEFTGVLTDFRDGSGTAVVSSEQGKVGIDFGYSSEAVRVYSSNDDSPIIRTLGARFLGQIQRDNACSPAEKRIALRGYSREDLVAKLRGVRQYRDAVFEVQEVMIDERLRVSQSSVKEFKLLQAARLAREVEEAGFQWFAPCCFELADGSVSVVTPPVVELTSLGPVLIDGHARVFHLALEGRDRFTAVVVSEVMEPLPLPPRPFNDLKVSYGTVDASTNMPGLNRNLFRKIEEAVHS